MGRENSGLPRFVVLCLYLVLTCPALSMAQELRSAEEAVRIGGPNAPEYAAFTREPDLELGSDGRLFVRSNSPPFVAVFTPDAEYVGTIGRRGEGPGEFRNMMAHGFLGDTLWILDFPGPRVSRFADDGTHLATTRLEWIDFGMQLSGPQSVSALLEGGRAIAEPLGFPTGLGGRRLPVPVFMGDPLLVERAMVAEVIQPQGMLVDGSVFMRRPPFPIPPMISVRGDGGRVLIADWTEDAPGDLRLTSVDPSGAQEWTRSFELPRPEVSGIVLERAIQEGIDLIERGRASAIPMNLGGSESPEVLARAGLHIPTWLPPIDLLSQGMDGTIWLGLPASEVEKEWLILDPEGTPVARTRLPSSVTVRSALDDRVWGTEVGEFDVPYVVGFDLR